MDSIDKYAAVEAYATDKWGVKITKLVRHIRARSTPSSTTAASSEDAPAAASAAAKPPTFTILDEEEILALLLIRERYQKKEKSEWAPFLSLLPDSHDAHPLYYEDEEVEAFAGSTAYERVVTQRAQVASYFEALSRVIGEVGESAGFPPSTFTKANYVWALATIATQSLTMPVPIEAGGGGAKTLRFIPPFLNFFRHSEESHARFEYIPPGGALPGGSGEGGATATATATTAAAAAVAAAATAGSSGAIAVISEGTGPGWRAGDPIYINMGSSMGSDDAFVGFNRLGRLEAPKEGLACMKFELEISPVIVGKGIVDEPEPEPTAAVEGGSSTSSTSSSAAAAAASASSNSASASASSGKGKTPPPPDPPAAPFTAEELLSSGKRKYAIIQRLGGFAPQPPSLLSILSIEEEKKAAAAATAAAAAKGAEGSSSSTSRSESKEGGGTENSTAVANSSSNSSSSSTSSSSSSSSSAAEVSTGEGGDEDATSTLPFQQHWKSFVGTLATTTIGAARLKILLYEGAPHYGLLRALRVLCTPPGTPLEVLGELLRITPDEGADPHLEMKLLVTLHGQFLERAEVLRASGGRFPLDDKAAGSLTRDVETERAVLSRRLADIGEAVRAARVKEGKSVDPVVSTTIASPLSGETTVAVAPAAVATASEAAAATASGSKKDGKGSNSSSGNSSSSAASKKQAAELKELEEMASFIESSKPAPKAKIPAPPPPPPGYAQQDERPCVPPALCGLPAPAGAARGRVPHQVHHGRSRDSQEDCRDAQ